MRKIIGNFGSIKEIRELIVNKVYEIQLVIK